MNISKEAREAAANLGYIIVPQWVAYLIDEVLKETIPSRAADVSQSEQGCGRCNEQAVTKE